MLYGCLAILLATTPLAATASTLPETAQSIHRQVHGEQLKSWYDQNKAMVVLDARSKPYFDGVLLPSATWLAAESSEKEIQAAIPAKNSLVVVYCAGIHCPASGWLYDKLASMGYENVYEYHEGLEDWINRGFPTE